MFLRSLALALTAAATLAACGQQARANLAGIEGDSFAGPADAKVTVVEYGSPTCPACKSWYDDNWAQLKKEYVDTGKVKFVFREFAIHGAIDAAIFSVARCVGQKDYFPVLDEAFARQNQIVEAAQQGKAVDAVKSLGQKFGLSGDQVVACTRDSKNLQRIISVQEDAAARGVNSTPTFLINDQVISDGSYSSMKATIDALLAGQAAPAQVAPADDGHGHAPGEQH